MFEEVKPDICDENVVGTEFDSEVLFPRHKRTTSGYVSSDVRRLSSDEIDAEIQRVEVEAAKIEKDIAVLSRTNDLSPSESVVSLDHTKSQLFRNVTARDARQHPRCTPTSSLVRHHTSESAPATSTVHQLTGRQPTTARQLVNASSSPPPVRHHSSRQPPSSSPTKFRARRLPVVSEADNVKDAVSQPVRVSDLKYGLVEGREADLPFELKRAKAVRARDHMTSADMCSKKSSCGDSESELSNSVQSAVPKDDVVSKRVAIRAVSTGNAVKSKLKPIPCVANVVSKSDSSDNEYDYDNPVIDECSVVKGDKLKRSKRVAVSVRDHSEVQPSKSKSVSSSVPVESESESDEKHNVLSRRRVHIKPDKFDGVTPTFATFKAQFVNAAKFNHWNDDEQLAFLKSSLTGSAAQCLWDQDESYTDTLDKLWRLLSGRFAGQNLAEKYRTELRNRRRKPGESLDSLCQDIRRLLILAYPGPSSSAHEAIAKDSFIDALSSELCLKVRERDPPTLDSALHSALRLESIHQAAVARDTNDDNGRVKGRARGITADSTQYVNDEVMSMLQKIQVQLNTDRKAFNSRLDNVEATMQHQSTLNTQPLESAMRTNTKTSSQNQSSSANNKRNTIPTSGSNSHSTPQRTCYTCGDPTHLMRQCPNARNTGFAGPQWRMGSNNSYQGQHQNRGSTAAATRGLNGHLDNGHVYLAVHIDGKRHLALLDSG